MGVFSYKKIILFERLLFDICSKFLFRDFKYLPTYINFLNTNYFQDFDDITSKSLALILEDMGQPEAASIVKRYI